MHLFIYMYIMTHFNGFTQNTQMYYLTIRPVARKGYELIAHEGEGRMGY